VSAEVAGVEHRESGCATFSTDAGHPKQEENSMPRNQVPHQGRFEPRSRRPLVRLWRTFLTGLIPIVPVTVTGYVVYWVFTSADSLFRGIGEALLPPGWYFPGLGLVLAVLVVLALGALLNASVYGRLALRLGNRLLERIPLVKTVYGGVRDLMLFVARPPDSDTRHVVLVTLPGDIRLIGFITDPAPAEAVPELGLDNDETVLAVYLPMSYQIGGYTLYLPERCVQRLEMPVEAGMRMVLTAGMNRPRTDSPAAQ
jgi:uncharacterized membrane protein